MGGVIYLSQKPKWKKEYQRSPYYKEFGEKFHDGSLSAPQYRFYNSAVRRQLPIEYIKQKSNGFAYFIFDHTVFLFPDFEQMDYDCDKAVWKVNSDGDWEDFDASYESLLALIDCTPELPVKVLVERKMVLQNDLTGRNIPECVFLTWSYEEAFEN